MSSREVFTFKKLEEEDNNAVFAEDIPDEPIQKDNPCSFSDFNSLISKPQKNGLKRSRSTKGSLKGILDKNHLKRKLKRRRRARGKKKHAMRS